MSWARGLGPLSSRVAACQDRVPCQGASDPAGRWEAKGSSLWALGGEGGWQDTYVKLPRGIEGVLHKPPDRRCHPCSGGCAPGERGPFHLAEFACRVSARSPVGLTRQKVGRTHMKNTRSILSIFIWRLDLRSIHFHFHTWSLSLLNPRKSQNLI